MKKNNTFKQSLVTIFFVATILFSISQVFGQNYIQKGTNQGAGNIYYTGGNMGIGTASPTKLLEVSGYGGEPTIRLTRTGIGANCKGNESRKWDIINSDGLHFAYDYFDDCYTPISEVWMTLTEEGQLALGTETPHASSILHLNTTDKGLLIPKLTNAQMKDIEAPANGLLIYNIDKDAFAFYQSGSWHTITDADDLDNYLTITAFNSSPAGGITNSDINKWNTAFGWGKSFRFWIPYIRNRPNFYRMG